jgi:hypothetical protein
MRKIKLFEDFKDELPFSLEEIKDIFMEFEDLDMPVKVVGEKGITTTEVNDDDLSFDFGDVIKVVVTFPIDRISYRFDHGTDPNVTDIMENFRKKYSDIFNSIEETLKSRGCKVDIKSIMNFYVFTITNS